MSYTPNRISLEADRELFKQQVAWAAANIGEQRIAQIVGWICRNIENVSDIGTTSLQNTLLRLLRIDAPEQIEAEKKLIALLDRRLCTKTVRWKKTDVPTRSVDWSETYRYAQTSTPLSFINRTIERPPDKELVGALSYQAQQWRDLLPQAGKYEERRQQLNAAIERRSPDASRHMNPLTSPLLHRLRRQSKVGRQLATLLNRIYSRQQKKPREIATTIVSAIDKSDQLSQKAGSNTNWNYILELSVLMAITRAADSSPTWSLTNMSSQNGSFQAFLSHADRHIDLEIRKSPPGDDVYVSSIRERAGLTKIQSASNSQPDICLTFKNTQTEDEISILGDAKRNGNKIKEGAGYFREALRTATYYLSAYSKPLGVRYSDGEGPVGKIRPTFTLFCRQGVEITQLTQEALINERHGHLPPILAFDIESQLAAYRSLSVDNVSSSPDWLSCWIRALTQQAEDHLC